MMTPQPDDHTLNACLARVIGMEIHEDVAAGAKYYWHINPAYQKQCWSPVTCPIQMERVEAWLKQNGIEFIISSAHLCNLMIVELILADGIFQGRDPNKKRALALAVWEMNNNK